MRILLVGGGKVGAYLARELERAGHTLVIIEADMATARDLAERTGALVLQGDATEMEIIQQADVEHADLVVAVTGKDEANFVACQLARTLMPEDTRHHILARLNDPSNRATFDALGIPVVAVTDLMVQVISREVEIDVAELVRIALVGGGKVSLFELVIPAGVPDKRVIDLDLPRPSILVTVVRGDQVSVPQADTVLVSGDRVLAVAPVASEMEVRRALCPVPD